MKRLISKILVLFAFAFLPAFAQPTVMVTEFNPVINPSTIVDTYAQCRNDMVCARALDAAAAYFGIDTETMATVDAAVLTFRPARGSEETFLTIAPPPGYRVCRSEFTMKSIVPAGGERSSHFSLQAASDRVQVYSWTPKRRLTQGRSWIDAILFTTIVPDHEYWSNLEAGYCNVQPTAFTHFTCRGTSGAHGFPGCPGHAEVRHHCPDRDCPRF